MKKLLSEYKKRAEIAVLKASIKDVDMKIVEEYYEQKDNKNI